MGKLWEWWINGLGKFGGFQATNLGRTLVVLFKLPPLVLGGRGCGRNKRYTR